jgi:hypothetical protein
MGGKTGGAIANVFGQGEAWSAQESAKASKKAAAAQTASTNAAIETEWNMYQQARDDYAPWREAGGRALTSAEKLIKEGPGEFVPEEQPGYEFGYKNFIENPYLSAQSAKGKRLSGETVKGLTKYAQDYASTSYDNFLARYYQKLNPLLSLSGSGQVSAGASGQAAQQTGGVVANLQQNIGQIAGQNALNQAALYGQAAQTAERQVNSGVNMISSFYGRGSK